MGLNWAGDHTCLFETFFLFSARVSDGEWLVGWLMSELAVCRNGGGGVPWVVWALLKSWLAKLVDIMLVPSFPPFVFCFYDSFIF